MEKRVLGRTGHESTLVTLGGAVFMDQGYPVTREEGDAFVRFALDHGVNHIDVAPSYGDAELRLGKWVREHRGSLFLACKTRKRTKGEVAGELRRSLKRLQTDYFDLYQLHALDDPGELEVALGENGAVQAILEAKDDGLVKHVGITSHNPENILRALKGFDFGTVLLPVNYVLGAHPEPKNDYKPVLALARERKIGVIAMKSIAKEPWPTSAKTHNTWYHPFETQKEIDEAVRFTLSQGVTTATTSSDVRIARMMIEAAERYKPMSKREQKEMLMKASGYRPLFPRVPG